MSDSNSDAFNLGAALEGQVLKNHYRIEQLVARGGMAWLYRATHLILQEPMAVKLLYPQLSENPKIRNRFIEEAKIQFRLKHPHIVQVTDVIQERGMLGSVMEWVDGEDAKQYIKRQTGPLQLPAVWAIVEPILHALHYAHELGLVHRDIKPANILLHWQGTRMTPKLSDFGIAKIASDAQEGQTATGATLGTMEYMAPEQIRDSKRVDLRADIYSVGVMLYQMVTGYLPFVGGPEVLLYKQLYESPTSPRSYVPDLPVRLEEIILRCLNKTLEERFQNCMELSLALSSLVADVEDVALKPTLDMPRWLEEKQASSPSQDAVYSAIVGNPKWEAENLTPSRVRRMSLPSASSESSKPILSQRPESLDISQQSSPKPGEKKPGEKKPEVAKIVVETPIPAEHYQRKTVNVSSFDLEPYREYPRPKRWWWAVVGVLLGGAMIWGGWHFLAPPTSPPSPNPRTTGTIRPLPSLGSFHNTNDAATQARTLSPQTTGTDNRPVSVASSSCQPGESRACYSGPTGTQDRGICKAGRQSCNQGTFGPCTGEILPATQELCNDKDDNCDGKIDETFLNKDKPCIVRNQSCTFLGVWTCHPSQTSLFCRSTGRLQNPKNVAIHLRLRPKDVTVRIKIRNWVWAMRNYLCLEIPQGDPISLSAKGYQLCQFMLSRYSRYYTIRLKPKSDLEEEPGYCIK